LVTGQGTLWEGLVAELAHWAIAEFGTGDKWLRFSSEARGLYVFAFLFVCVWENQKMAVWMWRILLES
jgi:hypothetical protein